MKILVLNGSPRPGGDTAAMIAAFQEEAEHHGHEVVRFDVCRMDIKGCLACEYCHGKRHGECIQKDDMQKVYSVFITMFCACTIILITFGPEYTFGGPQKWLHLIVPILAIILFLSVETGRKPCPARTDAPGLRFFLLVQISSPVTDRR